MSNLQEGIQLQAGLFVDGVKALIERAVLEAIANAAAPGAGKIAGNGGQGQQKEGSRRSPTKPRRTARKRAPKRSAQEMAALAERLYEAIDSQPGQTMGVLAGAMDCEPKDLRVSIRTLLKGGRVKKAGEGTHTTYFPMGTPEASVSESSNQ